MSANASFAVAADVLDGWRDDVLTGKAPVLYPLGAGELARIEVGPGLVTLFGGAPGTGKTAVVMQGTFDALRLTPTLRALVCNVEMPPAVLLDRQLARLSGVPLDAIAKRKLGAEHADRIDRGLATLESVADRLAFVVPPFDLGNIAVTADDFGGALLVFDYLQRIRPPGEHADKRGSVDALMDYLRQFADAGCAVLAVSAVARTKDQRGRSSSRLDIRSREFHGHMLRREVVRCNELNFPSERCCIRIGKLANEEHNILLGSRLEVLPGTALKTAQIEIEHPVCKTTVPVFIRYG